MDEISGMTRCIEVSFQGMRFTMEASQNAIKLLSRILQVLYNSSKFIGNTLNPYSEKKIARKLAKETGQTSMELLKMKGQFMFGKMDDKTFKQFMKQANKYGIQFAMAPTQEKGVKRISVRDMDIAGFELFLKDYEKRNCKTQEDIMAFRRNNGLDSPMEYMSQSKIGTCSEEEYKKAMEMTYGKEWDKEPPILPTMDAEKKREVFGAITENEIKQAKDNGKHFVNAFEPSQIFREDEFTVSFSKGSFEKGEMVNITVDKADLRYFESEGKEMFVALVPEEEYIKVDYFGDTISKGTVKAADYMKDPVNSIANADDGQELAAVTISKDLVKEKSETSVTTRIPGTFGKDIKYLTLPLSEVTETHHDKSYLTYIDLKKTYILHSGDNTISSMTGKELKTHYDDISLRTLTPKPVFKKSSKKDSLRNPGKAGESVAKKK